MTTLVLSILNISYSILQIRTATIKARMSLNFVKIPSPIKELAAGSLSLYNLYKTSIEYKVRIKVG